jgi:hypothetical protein
VAILAWSLFAAAPIEQARLRRDRSPREWPCPSGHVPPSVERDPKLHVRLVDARRLHARGERIQDLQHLEGFMDVLGGIHGNEEEPGAKPASLEERHPRPDSVFPRGINPAISRTTAHHHRFAG